MLRSVSCNRPPLQAQTSIRGKQRANTAECAATGRELQELIETKQISFSRLEAPRYSSRVQIEVARHHHSPKQIAAAA
jgi:hypothetical protein